MCFCLSAQQLDLPPRPAGAPTGSEFARSVAILPLAEREQQVYSQVMAGNVPEFLRTLCPVQITGQAPAGTNRALFYATPDYLAIGSDNDYLLMPISPGLGQRLADALDCSLPTPKMVNGIYAAAAVKLAPAPIPPSPAMTTVAAFTNHNETIRGQRATCLQAEPLGALVAGHKKDVVICARLAEAPGKVAIYGWHKTNGVPIQPLYLGHTANWVDYSQCIRLVSRTVLVNGEQRTLPTVLGDPELCGLFSDEGVVSVPRYVTNAAASVSNRSDRSDGSDRSDPLSLTALQDRPQFHEQAATFRLEPEVRIHINAPAREQLTASRRVMLAFYALPNGNTIEETIGRTPRSAQEERFGIQHIGAQTRFARQLWTNTALVVVYMQAVQKSWPAWRKKHGDQLIPELVSKVKGVFADYEVETVLSGHSGGGSFIFGYLNAVQQIPADVTRIAFLDSNYAYDRALAHKDKLVAWLQGAADRYLCVLAYDDANALLNGKPFVSAAGGSWGRSHAMQSDLAEEFRFNCVTNSGFERYTALDGRIRFILKENPGRKIFHTVQVERNGFIHVLALGTPNENKGYEYFGPRAYATWVQDGSP